MSTNHSFSDTERNAVYKAIRERRDVRRFRSDPIDDAILTRLLTAASHAPSVGYMQPWNFILINDMGVRRDVHRSFVEANNEAEAMFAPERRNEYAALKLEGILECALNICITCDRERFGTVGLGRTHQPEMDLYSSVCAVQNLWLAARAEGVGVGWVSIIKPEALKAILHLPDQVVPIAYLCVGYTEHFAAEPELKTAGWNPEIALADFIFHDRWGNK